jgi:hypothetical protein
MRGSREINRPMEEGHTMNQHQTPEQGFRREAGDEQAPKTVWGHSLAAAAICLGTGAAIALIAIFGQPG